MQVDEHDQMEAAFWPSDMEAALQSGNDCQNTLTTPAYSLGFGSVSLRT
jgi:hypothetical protein